MKNNATLADRIPADTLSLALSFVNFPNCNFSDQVAFLGLNPKTDFQNSDLTHIDFSNSDICGYNFTGSDLRGAVGINVRWDDTTIFDQADTAGSLFSYSLSQKTLLADNPQVADKIKRIAKEHWTRAILDVRDILAENNTLAVQTAQAVFDLSADYVVKSNILYFMRLSSGRPNEHRDFILNALARHSEDPSIIVSSLRVLTALYRNDRDAQNIFLSALEHPNEKVRLTALSGLLSTAGGKSRSEQFLDQVIALNDSSLRRRFVYTVAKSAGKKYLGAVIDDEFNNAIDFLQPLTHRKLSRMAENSLRREKFEMLSQARKNFDLLAATAVDEKLISARAREFHRLITELRTAYKIPFRFDEVKK